MRYLALLASVVGLAGCPKGDNFARSILNPDQAAAARQACMFKAGTLPGMSLAFNAPLGGEIPIDTFVLVMMENRSFDHMLQNLNAFGARSDVEVAPGTFANVQAFDTTAQTMLPSPVSVPIFHLSDYCFEDTSHGWTDVHHEWNNGKMDQFVYANDCDGDYPAKPEAGCPHDVWADGKRAMGYYTEDDLPWFYTIANTFSLADHNFSSVLGPTYPNRMFFYAATSFGHIGNDIIKDQVPTILQELDAANVDFRVYKTSLPGVGVFLGTYSNYLSHTFAIAHFYDDAAAGTLGQVNYIDPYLSENKGALQNDFHPPGDVQVGQQFLHDIVDAMFHSPQWPHSAIIITFDEHGGIYDHVPPPTACAPDALQPMLNQYDNAPGGFDQYGVRVPMIIISPYSKPSFVSHNVYDHTSVLRLLEARFNMPALTGRDANADPLLDMFDFSQPRMIHPPTLPAATTDAAKLAACQQKFPDNSGMPMDMGVPTDMSIHD